MTVQAAGWSSIKNGELLRRAAAAGFEVFLTPDRNLEYQQKFGHGSNRVRKIGIVALARKLLIAFWRYLETGVIPEGAMLRA